MKKIVEEERQGYSRSVNRGTKMTFETGDETFYVFWILPWFNYPVFSHRYEEEGVVKHTDSRNFNLPNKVEERLWEEYGGYYMADGKVGIEQKEKHGYTIVRPVVGDMYPLREPDK